MKFFSLFLVLPFLFFSVLKNGDEVCTLSIELSNIRKKDGKIFIFLYNYENQWPDNPFMWFEVDKSSTLNRNKITYKIESLKKGKYVISLLDDENMNNDLDKILGLPVEGYGFSNNIKPFFSVPEYRDLIFDLNDDHQLIRLKLQYLF